MFDRFGIVYNNGFENENGVLKINLIGPVQTRKNRISTCDILFRDNIRLFYFDVVIGTKIVEFNDF